jgi:hypothetical protein
VPSDVFRTPAADSSSALADAAIAWKPESDPISGRIFAIALGCILVLGASLRFGALGLHSFWFDEVTAMRVARAPNLAERLARMDKVGAPLHPLLLRYWTAAWGASEAAARGLSACFSVLSLCALAAAAWQAFRSRAAVLTATALLAVCPLDLALAMESRMYTLLAFGTVACWGLLFSFRRGRGLAREFAFGLGLVGRAYTHPLGGLMILALGLGYLIDVRGSSLPPARWLAIQALAAAAILPWASRYMDHPPDPELGIVAASTLTDWIAYGLGWPVWSLPALVVVVGLAWLVPDRGRREISGAGAGDASLRTGLMLCTWFVGTLILMAAYSRLRHPILGPIRYQLFLMPAVLLLIAGASRRRPATTAGPAALVLAFTLPALRAEVFNERSKPAWREAAPAVMSRSPNPALVLAVREPHMYYQTVDDYLPDGTPVLSLQAYLDRRAAGALDRSREYWLFHDEMIAERLAFF